MTYRMNSGDITLPRDWTDETLHIFKAPGGYNLVVNGDPVPAGVSEQDHLKAQYRLFEENLANYRELHRQAIAFADGTWPLIEYQWDSPEGKMFQINLMYIADQTLTSFTFTATEPFTAVQKQEIQTVLKSFEPVKKEV